MRPSLGALLIKAGLASEQDVRDATDEGQATGERLGEWVIRKGLANDELIAKLLAEQWQLPYASSDELEIDEVATLRISRRLARELAVHPIRYDGETLVMATAEPHTDLFAEVAERIGEASYVVVSRSTLESLLGAPLKPTRDEAAVDGGWETGGSAETFDTGSGDRGIAADALEDPPLTARADEVADPVPESGADVGPGSPVDTTLASIDAALQESERLRDTTGMLNEALRVARNQIVEQQVALAAAEEAREREGEMTRTLESAISEKNELFQALREQVATLTTTLDGERAVQVDA
ncbi:MAG TPA: hypothetical protein VMU73_03335 [Gaiellaceae bacterium]|nr:hypothetical protein [Gaiellaceae bacterium]